MVKYNEGHKEHTQIIQQQWSELFSQPLPLSTAAVWATLYPLHIAITGMEAVQHWFAHEEDQASISEEQLFNFATGYMRMFEDMETH